MKRIFLIFGLGAATLALAACGGDKIEPLAVPESELGPDTGDLIKELPGGLVGDRENARYTGETLRGEDETP